MWQPNVEQAAAMLESIQSIKPFQVEAWEYVEPDPKNPGKQRGRWAAKLSGEDRARVGNGNDMREVLMVLSDEIARLGEPEHSLFVAGWALPAAGSEEKGTSRWDVRLSRTGTTADHVCIVYEARKAGKV